MIVLGITGSSGSGKTATSYILNQRADTQVIDADEIAKELNQIGTEYLKSIRNVFGDSFFFEDGNLNRKALANEIYTSKESLEKLNELTFEYVVKEIVSRLQKIKDKKIVVIDAPLLFEAGLNKYCNYTISLIAEKELKVERICLRDNIDRQTALKRLSIQQNDEFYIKNSDFIIKNNKNCNLELEIEKIMSKLNAK